MSISFRYRLRIVCLFIFCVFVNRPFLNVNGSSAMWTRLILWIWSRLFFDAKWSNYLMMAASISW